MALDARGVEIRVGDTVAYAVRRFSSTYLRLAVVINVLGEGAQTRISARVETTNKLVQIKNLDTLVVVERRKTEDEIALADQVLAVEAEAAVYRRQRDEARERAARVTNALYTAIRHNRRLGLANELLLDDLHGIALDIVRRPFGFLRRLAALLS